MTCIIIVAFKIVKFIKLRNINTDRFPHEVTQNEIAIDRLTRFP